MINIKTELDIQKKIKELQNSKVSLSSKNDIDMISSQIKILQWVISSSNKKILTSEELKKHNFNLELG